MSLPPYQIRPFIKKKSRIFPHYCSFWRTPSVPLFLPPTMDVIYEWSRTSERSRVESFPERGAVSRMRQLGGDYAVFAPRILMTSPIRGTNRHRRPHSHCPCPTYHSYSPSSNSWIAQHKFQGNTTYNVHHVFFAFWAPNPPSEVVILLKRHGCKQEGNGPIDSRAMGQ